MNITLFNKNRMGSETKEPTPPELLQQFETWAGKGDYAAILADLPKMTTPTQHYLAMLSLSWAYHNSRQYAEAEKSLREVAEQGREDALWHFLLAEVQIMQDNTEGAVRHALLARGKDPQFPWSYLLLGKLFYFNGNITAAREYLITGGALAREAGCDDSDFAWLLQEIENGNDPAVLLKA